MVDVGEPYDRWLEIAKYPTLKEVSKIIQEAKKKSATDLNLSRLGLKEIPKEITSLEHLTTLNLCGNQLTEIPEFISQLTKLNTLNLSGNQLTEIPDFLLNLPGFTKLRVRHHEHISGEGALTIGLNPVTTPPQEVLAQGIEAARNYYRQLREEGTEKLYEAKLLVVGEAGAGKTTLAQKIQNRDYQLDTLPSTEGIDILHWQFQHSSGSSFRVNIWDFGGQEIYHSTHQFFLTRRSCYVLVADNRKEDDNLYYWLSIVELLAEDSPVLVVKNEKGDRQRDLNCNQMRGEFPQLKDSLATNLKTDRGFSAILSRIRYHLTNLPHIGDELPKTWVRVRKALEDDPRNTISLDTYLQICEENGFKKRRDALQLGRYLHDLGVFLHFQDDDLLTKTIILKPTWGTDAVYKVLGNPIVRRNQGRFTRQDIERVWFAEEYVGLHGELLKLMMKFQLCYELPSHPRSYIAPQLLNPNQPRYPWNESNNLLLRYSYEFMPKGILTRLIVALHRSIATLRTRKRQMVWRTGVILAKNQTFAEVIEFHDRRKIDIRLQGKNKRDLLTVIAHEIDKIHENLHRLKYKKLIPCNCNSCQDSQFPNMYDLEHLRERLRRGKQTVECYKSYEDVNVRGLIDDSVGSVEAQQKSERPPQVVTNIYQNNFGDGDNVGNNKNIQNS
ncbi:MAG: COR domain-containing protein [Geitlerinemataceae cyanobacterium]